MASIYLTALGCRLNEAELQMWAEMFREQGLSITSTIEAASLMVINTCAVTGEAARKSRQSIRRLHRKNPQAKLVVTGCYAAIEKQQAQELLGVDLVVDNAQKDQLPDLVKPLLNLPSMPFSAIEPEESAIFVRNKERAFIKIQDGCRYRCTYCIVTLARGDEKSRTIDELVKEVSELEKKQVKEIVLTGVHVGGYGVDLNSSLYDLVVAILNQTSIPRIRFASVEPWDLPENFFELFKNKRLMPHMHLPMQSGSNQILKKMARRCKSEEFLNLVKKARKVVPEFNITTDIIVGFPGEADADFESSKQLIESAKIGHTHIFSYSNREGTKAARLPGQVASDIKKQRSQVLHQQAKIIKQQAMNSMINKEQAVLCEGQAQRLSHGGFRTFGYTENYHKVYIEHSDEISLNNQILDCKLVNYDSQLEILVGKPLKPINTKNQSLLVKEI